jgi:hypothetical protein
MIRQTNPRDIAVQLEREKRNLRKQLSTIQQRMPKYQALARIKVDIDASFESLRGAGLKPRLVGGRPSGTPGEAQVSLTLDDPIVSALISKSLVQISSPSPEQIYRAVDVFQKHLIFERGQPSLLASLSCINEPQRVIQNLKKQLAGSELKNMELEERLQRLTEILLTLDQDLSSLDTRTKQKIRPILKRALDDYCQMSTSGP